mgnify:CR=1 FL=1
MLLLAASVACHAGSGCEEPDGAQVLDERVEVHIGDDTVLAELADDPTERERGWRKRSCDRDAILLVPDEPGPLPLWGCDLVDAVDAVGLRNDEVVYVAEVAPCALPCGACPTVGDGVTVDAVLETPVGLLDVEPGDPSMWP